jgi:predicted MFS family arabinose efflux permease
MSEVARTPAQEWRDGWTLVLSTFVGFSFLSVMTGSLPMFIEPLTAEFGWSRAFVSIGFTAASIITALLSPFFGIAVDRWGSRRVALPGIVATVLCICAFATASGSQSQWVLLWSIYAVISISVKTTVWTAAVVRRFTAAQGLALGITLCGVAAAQVILPPLSNWLIETYGWRMAYLFLGLGWGSVTFILCALFLFDAHDRKPLDNSAANRAVQGDLPGLTVAQAARDWALWRVAISTFFIMLLTMGLTIHQIAILGEAGVARSNAAWLASLAGLAGIAGKLVSGVLLDRFRANWVGGVTLGATALAFALLIDGINSPPLIVLAMLVNGYTAGTKLQISGYLTSRYAGPRSFGTVYGFINSVIAAGAALGPVVAGFAYDTAGNYQPFLIVGAIGCVLCGLLLLTLPRYPTFITEETPIEAEAEGQALPA